MLSLYCLRNKAPRLSWLLRAVLCLRGCRRGEEVSGEEGDSARDFKRSGIQVRGCSIKLNIYTASYLTVYEHIFNIRLRSPYVEQG